MLDPHWSPSQPLKAYRPFWAKRFGTAPFLPMSRAEMSQLGWDSCDVILVTGDAYVDHPSFGMAVVGRVLESQGFRVGIIAQPDWTSADAFKALGQPNLFWGVTSGNMDSMINRYTADHKIRSDDAYTPGNVGGKRPDRAAIVYCQRCREAYPGTPIVLGGIEGSLRRIAHYDYWSDKVRRSIVVDSKCDLLLYGNAERALVEVAHRIAKREPMDTITDVRGTAFVRRSSGLTTLTQGADGVEITTQMAGDWLEIDSTEVDRPGRIEDHVNPYLTTSEAAKSQNSSCSKDDEAAAKGQQATPGETVLKFVPSSALKNLTLRPTQSPQPTQATQPITSAQSLVPPAPIFGVRSKLPRHRTVIRLPSYEQVKSDPVLYAHASRVLHLETNPGNARALVQAHGTDDPRSARDVWINPPPIPLSMEEMDGVFDLFYARSPHPRYADENGSHDHSTKIPAWEMIRFSVNIMRGCFGGCTFCSITEHEGRIIQSRSSDSIVRELEDIRDKVKGFTGVISDLGGPTANMYRLSCKTREIEAACRKPSCVFPGICSNLITDHNPLIRLYRRARELRGIKKILISSGLRYDLAVQSPEYVKELVTHHVGGYLKIAPEHTESGPLSKMMKPGIGSYDRFKQLFEKFSAEAGKKQYLIPYFIAAHPGTSDEDMMHLAIWLKQNGFRADQVQTFYPSPMATATAMYHTGLNPLSGIHRDERVDKVDIVKGERRRRLHKAFLRYHDANNWPLLREALTRMGRSDLIGNGKKHLIPSFQPTGASLSAITGKGAASTVAAKTSTHATTATRSHQPKRGTLLTQHTGLPPRRVK
jgi:uncharacterized radical SAM protein YgiQ